MKRRDFVLGSSAVAVGQLMTPQSANAQQGSLPLVRWTRVAPMSSFLQDIVVENGFIYALAHLPIDQSNPVHRQWSVTQTTIDGQFVHQHQLPQGKYASIGLHDDAIWVHAGTYYDDTGKAQRNQMLLLNDNGVEPAARLNMVNGVLRHAGPSALASLSNNSVDLWRFEESRLNLAASHTCSSKPSRYVETIEPGVGVLSALDGSHITIVEIASGIFRDATISLPEIATAQEHYATRADSRRGRPVVLSATGTRGDGILYAILMPSPSATVKVVKIDTHGRGAGALALAFPPRQGLAMTAVPTRLVFNQAEVGVVHMDASIGWFAS